MNKNTAKKIRKLVFKKDVKEIGELKTFINSMAFWPRVKIAWHIICGKF